MQIKYLFDKSKNQDVVCGGIENVWIYLIAPFVGAIMAGFLYQFAIMKKDKVDDEFD